MTYDVPRFRLYDHRKQIYKHYLRRSYVFADYRLIIVRQLLVDRKILVLFIVRLSYNNLKMFSKLDISRKSIVSWALS